MTSWEYLGRFFMIPFPQTNILLMALDFKFTLRFSIERVIIIDGLRSSDMQTGYALYNEFRDLKARGGMVHSVQYHKVEHAGELREVLEKLAVAVRREGFRPIIHFECHGDLRLGLEIGEGRELFGWTELERLLRAINVASSCNLGVVMGVCYGIYAVTPISIHRPTPFYFLIGSKRKLQQGEIADEFKKFYAHLFSSSDLTAATKLVPSCDVYFAEKLLAITLGKFYKRTVIGNAGLQKVEELVTTERWRRGGFFNREELRKTRKLAKQHVKSSGSKETFDRYAKTFLTGKKPAFTHLELINWLKAS
jgi:hypothetical protein